MTAETTSEALLEELTKALDESNEEPLALVAFVVRDNEEHQSVKVMASFAPGTAAIIQPAIVEAFDEVVSADVSKKPSSEDDELPDPHRWPAIDRMAHCLVGPTFEDLSQVARGIWEFNTNTSELIEALVAAGEVRRSMMEWYAPFKQFLDTDTVDMTPGLLNFIARGPLKATDGDLAAMVLVAIAKAQPFDPNNPPYSFDAKVADAASDTCGKFIDAALKSAVGE